MLRRPIQTITAVIALSLVGSMASAQGPAFDLDKTKTVLTRMIERSLRERGVPSVSIALVRGDSIVWKAAFGYANVRTRTPATTETLYSTGSTFKAATATALLQLEEKGKLSLDHPVNRYLGDAQVKDRLQVEKPVTFTHILSHWSGLTAGAVTKPIWGRELPKTLETMVSGLYSIRAPETKWEYNNFAYGMAGLLVEKISGTDYETYMLANVLKPLGTTTPHPVAPSPEMVELMALPYMPGGASGRPRPVAQVHFDVYPAGDIYLTAEEMARFLGAHLNGGAFQGQRILTAESVKKAHEPRFGGTYGFGWSVRKDATGHTIISHTGGIPGQSSNMVGDVDAKVGVYYMSNSGAPGEIADAAIALLRGEDYTPLADRKGVAVDQKVLDSYVGVYDVTPEIALTITRDGANLFVQPGPQPRAQLLAVSTVKFMGEGITLTFARTAGGAVDTVVVEPGGGPTLTGKRRK